jgi:hypothetical protein
MVQNSGYKLPMPYSSWQAIQKILKAYNAVRDREKPTVQDIANLAGIHRPNVSANNNFLRELGLLQGDENKLTPLGTQLATGLEMNNFSMVTEAMQQSVRESKGISQLVDTLRARGTMSREAFVGQVVTLAQLTAKSQTLSYVGTIIDYLTGANLIREDGDNLVYMGHAAKDIKPPIDSLGGGIVDPLATPPPPPPVIEAGIPLPLGVGRLAYLKLPENWEPRELTKLVKMIELALGEDKNE